VEKWKGLALAGLGAVGVIGTGVSAAFATPKALEKVEKVTIERQIPKDKTDEVLFVDYKMTKRQKALIMAPYYIPAVLIGAVTIASIFVSYSNNTRDQAALVSAYTLIDSMYKEYREKNRELFGEENDSQVMHGLALAQFPDVVMWPDETLFLDEYSGRFFKSTLEEVECAIQQINQDFGDRECVELGEFYGCFALEPTNYEWAVGWSITAGRDHYKYEWINIDVRGELTNDGEEFYRIRFISPPTADFLF